MVFLSIQQSVHLKPVAAAHTITCTRGSSSCRRLERSQTLEEPAGKRSARVVSNPCKPKLFPLSSCSALACRLQQALTSRTSQSLLDEHVPPPCPPPPRFASRLRTLTTLTVTSGRLRIPQGPQTVVPPTACLPARRLNTKSCRWLLACAKFPGCYIWNLAHQLLMLVVHHIPKALHQGTACSAQPCHSPAVDSGWRLCRRADRQPHLTG
jgi:hypothetical protein